MARWKAKLARFNAKAAKYEVNRLADELEVTRLKPEVEKARIQAEIQLDRQSQPEYRKKSTERISLESLVNQTSHEATEGKILVDSKNRKLDNQIQQSVFQKRSDPAETAGQIKAVFAHDKLYQDRLRAKELQDLDLAPTGQYQ